MSADRTTPTKPVYLTIQDRTWIFVAYAGAAYALHGLVSNQWVPSGTGSGLWFVSVVGLLAFRLLASPFFARPKDAFVAALTGTFVLWALDLTSSPQQALLEPLRWTAAGMLAVVAVAGFVAVTLGEADRVAQPNKAAIGRWSYNIIVEFGRGEIVFTPPGLIGALGFGLTTEAAILLAGAWVVIGVAQPIERLVRTHKRYVEWKDPNRSTEMVGVIQRVDDPGIVRADLTEPTRWTPQHVLLARLADDKCVRVLPLFAHVRGADTIGTGLMVGTAEDIPLPRGLVVADSDPPDRASLLAPMVGEGGGELVGFVVEGSTIGTIQFEVATAEALEEGSVVYCQVASARVAYQITEAKTAEESFERNPRGTVVVSAVQLGVSTDQTGYERCLWTPHMNTPVFVTSPNDTGRPTDRFTLGVVPGTGDWIGGRFDAIAEFHGAVLGMTGTGKTELVFDIIREGLAGGAKIACVDFTEEYRARLNDCDPTTLGFTADRCAELAERVEAVETGPYGGAAEKASLAEFLTQVKPEVTEQVEAFLEADGPGLGVFELEDIANTRSTLRATELYLSEIFAWARKNRKAKKILVVLEEAHTVIPESNLFGFDKNETLAVIGRISQIALQGRKYGVGLLVVSQRTALVSKTILSQCGTIAAFALVDKTSLDYLSSVFDAEYCKSIPRLPPRRVVVTGPGVVTERPVIIDLPWDQAKADASAALAAVDPNDGPLVT